MWFFRAIAFDLDGTLAEGGQVDPRTLDLVRAAGVGRRLVLVTGRVFDELARAFPGLAEVFDVVVTENGAVLHGGSGSRRLAEPIGAELVAALAGRGVRVDRGEVLLAVDGAAAPAVIEEITALGLDHQVVRNRAAAMVLPAGVTKGSGLLAALADLGLSAHNVIAVGDAENDLALLQAAEVGAAVANAVPSLAARADLRLGRPDGAGVRALLDGPLLTGEQRLCPARRWIRIGVDAQGEPVTVPASQASILITGASGTGKSYLAGLLAEGWLEAGYRVLVIDPEGDHAGLALHPSVLHIDAAAHLPEPADLLALTRPGRASVVLDLSGLPATGKIDYLARLPAAILAERVQHGTPHWVIADEAQLSLVENLAGNPDRPGTARAEAGTCLVTWQPEHLPGMLRQTIDVTVTVTGPPPDHGLATPALHAAVQTRGGQPRAFTPARRASRHVRHQHKYATATLPEHRRFYFHTRHGGAASAGTLQEFSRYLRHCDPAVLSYHLGRDDFSRWITETLTDQELGTLLADVEREIRLRRAADLEHARDRIISLIETRYLTDGPG